MATPNRNIDFTPEILLKINISYVRCDRCPPTQACDIFSISKYKICKEQRCGLVRRLPYSVHNICVYYVNGIHSTEGAMDSTNGTKALSVNTGLYGKDSGSRHCEWD